MPSKIPLVIRARPPPVPKHANSTQDQIGPETHPYSGEEKVMRSATKRRLVLADTTNTVTYVTGDTVADPTKGTTFLADTGTGTPTQTTLPLNAAPTGSPPVYHSTQDLLSTTAPVANGATVALNLDYAIPTGSGAFNGGDADVVLTIHAVQDTSSNVLACTTVSPAVLGAQCLAGDGFGWS
jgi:hypothetical protein